MSRPKKAFVDQHVNRIAVYLTEEDDQLIRNLASRKGIAPAVLARAFIKARLDALAGLSGTNVAHRIRQ